MNDEQQTGPDPRKQQSQQPDPGPGGKGGSGEKDHDPCEHEDCGDGSGHTPESRCGCEGHCECECQAELPQGSIRRVLERLRDELKAPPACPGSPEDAKKEFEKALDEAEAEYQNIGAVEQKYREYHCQIDCELDKAESQCQDLRTWSEQVTSGERTCIERLWLCCYERPERRLLCECWMERRREYEGLKDCLEQAKAHETRAEEDFGAVKTFQDTLKARFEELKKLWDEAKKRFDAKEYLAVYALLLEYRQRYHQLGRLLLWEPLDGVTPEVATYDDLCEETPSVPEDHCDRPDLKQLHSKWLRHALMEALRNLIRARFHRYCWHQHWIDARHCTEQCKTDLDAFRGSRRKKFVLEAQDCAGEDDEKSGPGQTAG